MTRFRAKAQYDGTDFHGWQSQPSGNTVQDYIERRLLAILKTPVRIHGSGRTDSGVHSRGQVFHFDADWPHALWKLQRALRVAIPSTILIEDLEHAPADFHARFSACGKRYCYYIHEGYAPPTEIRYRYSLKGKALSESAMREAAAHLTGRHNFLSFAADPNRPVKDNPVKDLRRLDIERDGPRLKITAEADGFLYKMVRSLAGGLIEVGTGKLRPDQMPEILEGRQRTMFIPTAPAHGLFLEQVHYPQEALKSGAEG